ncbi:response regulator [Streptomyces sp. NPDC090445]|uniref:response regulator n=1 Tax=Streptomyces sp. NPDC090445 TaxID=3365963 RepID=UPI003825B22E
MVRVLLVDDEALVRVAVQRVLDSAPDIRTVTCDGPEAVRLARETAPDVALIDVNMPAVDGFSLIPKLRSLPRPPAIAMLTMLGSDQYLDTALRLGASGYLLKDTEPHLLIDCVRILARGGVVYVPPQSRSAMGARINAAQPAEAPGRLRGLLTNREHQVLDLVAEGLPNAEIAERLGVGMTTVKTHIGSLKKKLGVRSRVAIAAVAHREGGPDAPPSQRGPAVS